MEIPVISFVGFSGTGKTTLIEKLIRSLKSDGIRVAVVKHDAHGFEMDHEGKDTWRFTKAGADMILIASEKRSAVLDERPSDLWGMLGKIHDVDIVIVEGFKGEPLSQIGIIRKALGNNLPCPLNHYAAIVTDCDIRTEVPVFSLDDTEGIKEFIMQNQKDFTHFNEQGRATMVNVGGKDITKRTAVAGASVYVSEETFRLIESGGMKKGDVLTVAQIAGIMGAKRTPDIIPMCHPLQLNGIDLNLSLNPEKYSVEIKATISCTGRTGVEMEALTAASVAALTVYDMCKAVQKDILISDIRLLEKTGGIHGDFTRED